MSESLGSQFLRTTPGIQSGEKDLWKLRQQQD